MPPSRSQPETPMPPDRMTGFNLGPCNPHPDLSIWCVPGKRFATYYAIFLSENMWQYRKEWMGMWFVSRWHGSQIIWHKTGMSQHCHLTHPHTNTWLCKYVSNNIMLSETYFPIVCMRYIMQGDVHKNAMTILKCKHATTLIISRVQTCLPGSE